MMKVYIDLLFLLNCWIDFFLLIMVKLILKRIVKIRRIIFASLFGGLTTFIVFLNVNYLVLLFIKIILSCIIVLIAFGYKDIFYFLKNFIYLFMNGVILGGVASYIKINVNNINFYIISLIVITPLLVLIFNKQNKKIKKQYKLYYSVKALFNKKYISLCGFLDSGNRLRDPVTHKYIIIVNKTKLKGINKIRSPMYVPVKTINNNSLMKCYKPDKLYIEDKLFNSYLLGITEKEININGVDCLLNSRLLEDL